MASRTSTEFADALATRREGVFAEAELVGLSDTITHHFRGAIAPGAPLMTAVRLRMRGPDQNR